MKIMYIQYRWMEPLFCAGFCRELEHNDLYAHPSEADSEKLLKRFNRWVKVMLSVPGCTRFMHRYFRLCSLKIISMVYATRAVWRLWSLNHYNIGTGTLKLKREKMEDSRGWSWPFWSALGGGFFFMESWCLLRCIWSTTFDIFVYLIQQFSGWLSIDDPGPTE